MSMRTLALRLACLPQEDQRWVLSQLPVAYQEQLQCLRDEVVAMGLNTDPSLIALLSEQREQSVNVVDANGTDNAIDGKAVDFPPFWNSLLNGDTSITAFDHPEKLPPAMRASLYRLAESAVDQQG